MRGLVCLVLVLLCSVWLADAGLRIDASAQGRSLRNHRVVENGRSVVRNACKMPNLSHAQRLACERRRMVARSDKLKQKLPQRAPVQAPPPGPFTGYIVFAQWDGRTYPNVNWALDITRQSTEFSFAPNVMEMQYVNLIPARNGPINQPTYSSWDAQARNYFVASDNNDRYSANLWGINIAPSTNSSTLTYPQVQIKYPFEDALLVDLQSVYINGSATLLAFYQDGTVQTVNPTTGATATLTVATNITRQINAVTVVPDSTLIYLLTMNSDGHPHYAITTLNYANLETSDTYLTYLCPEFVDYEQMGFEMVWLDKLQRLMIAFTGNFDQLQYTDPVSGETVMAVFNMHDFKGAEGSLEFLDDTRLVDVDTDANMVVDEVNQLIYFQCSDVQDSGDYTTSLCMHPVQPDSAPSPLENCWTFIQVTVEPMTYGYVAAEFVQVEEGPIAAASVQSQRRGHRTDLKSQGRRVPVRQIMRNGVRVHQSACKDPEVAAANPNMCLAAPFAKQTSKPTCKAAQDVLSPLVPASHPVQADNFTGFLVFAQWDGRTFPDVEWALDITRQSTEYSFDNQTLECQYQLLVGTSMGNASKPTYTTYDESSRNVMVMTTKRKEDHHNYQGRLWGITVSGDTNSSKFTFPETFLVFPSHDSVLVGTESYVSAAKVQYVLAFFADGQVVLYDPTVGGAGIWQCDLTPDGASVYTVTASSNTVMHVVASGDTSSVSYSIVSWDVSTNTTTAVAMGSPGPSFVPATQTPFEMVWLPSFKSLLVMFTGNFDQIIYVNPQSGSAAWAVFNLAYYQGPSAGHLEFTVSNYLEDLDTDANVAVDNVKGLIYFQCSDVDPDSGEVTTALCEHPIAPDVAPNPNEDSWDFVNVNIWPMTYGYAGGEYVQKVPNA